MNRLLDETPIYYVYGHYKPGTDEIFYVGKGKEGRAHCGDRDYNMFWCNIVKKYKGFDVKLLLENLKEYEALCMEPMYINAYGRRNQNKGPLVNLTDGGEGVSGMISPMKDKKSKPCPEETKKKISNALKGRKLPKETCAKMSATRTGKSATWNIGKKRTEAEKENIRNKLIGRKRGPRSEISKQRQRITMTGKKRGPHKEETKAKIRESNKKNSKSQSEMMKAVWAIRKANASFNDV